MAEAPTPSESDRHPPGQSIANRLFARGATRASIGPAAEFYHRLGVDDPYSMEPSAGESNDGFTYLSSGAYFRDLRRSRLGLLSRLSGSRPLDRVGQRAQRIGPAAATIRPSALASLALSEDAFELLDDPKWVQEDEDADEVSWRTKPRAPKQKRMKARERIIYRPMQQAMAQPSGDTDALTQMLARALQAVRGSQRQRLRSLLEDVRSAAPEKREAKIRQSIRRLRGPVGSAIRGDADDALDATNGTPSAVAQSRGTASNKGLRRTLSASPSLVVLDSTDLDAEAPLEVSSAPRRRRRFAPAKRDRRPVEKPSRLAETRPSARPVVRQADESRADVGLSRVGSRAATRLATVVARDRSGLVDEDVAAPLARAATGHLSEARAPTRQRRAALRAPEAQVIISGSDAESAESEARPTTRRTARRRRPTAALAERAQRRDVERQGAAPLAVSSVPTKRAPLERSLSPLSDRTRPTELGSAELGSAPAARRRSRQAPATQLLVESVDVEDVPTSESGAPTRRPRVSERTPPRGAGRRPLSLISAPAPATTAKKQLPTERLVARSEVEAQTDALIASPVRYARPNTAPLTVARGPAEEGPNDGADAGTVARPSRRRRSAVERGQATATGHSSRVAPETIGERPTIRVARRGVVPAQLGRIQAGRVSGADAVAASPVRTRRSIVPAPTSYLNVTPEDVTAEFAGAGELRRARARAPQVVTKNEMTPKDRAIDVEVSAPARRMLGGETEPTASNDSPMFRAARRGVEAPVKLTAATVLPMATAYLAVAPDDVVDESPALIRAPKARRRAAAASPLVEKRQPGSTDDAPKRLAERVQRRSDESPVLTSAAERGSTPADIPADATPVRGTRRPVAAQLLARSEEDEAPTEESAPARPMVRASRRATATVRRDRKGRATLGMDAVPSARPVKRRRRAVPVRPSAAPSARAVSRLGAPTQRTVAPKPAPQFEWAMLLPELAEAAGVEASGPVPRRSRDSVATPSAQKAPKRRRNIPGAPAASVDESVSISLVDVVQRTRSAVRAMQRPEQSVLSFDATRRTFGESPRPRMHTVEARVDVDSEGRVRRVVAKRLSTGEQVLLVGDDVVDAAPLAAAKARRPSQGAWIEERVAVGRARPGVGGVQVEREAPGARLVERSAVPDVGLRVGRRSVNTVADGVVLSAPVEGQSAGVAAARPRRRKVSAPASSRVAARAERRSELLEVAGAAPARSAGMVAALGPVTLAAAAMPAEQEHPSLDSVVARRGPKQPAVARRSAANRRRSRGSAPSARPVLGSTLAGLSLDAPPKRRRSKAAVAGEPEWLDGQEDSNAPGWAHRAVGEGVGARKLPDIFSKPRVRTSGGLLTALARAGDAEEVVRVILQRSGDLDASMMPPAAQRLLFRVADEAGSVARQVGRSDRSMRSGATVAPQTNTVLRNVLEPTRASGQSNFGPRSRATTTQGVGASKVMKLANKLMKLIHLAESDGRGDAHKHVRMAENSSEARAEGGAGATSGEQLDEKSMNIKALRRDVLDAVLRALDDLRWRREDPDGPSIWC